MASHERSGTHFLMNTLSLNFGYISMPWIDIDIEQVFNPFAKENFYYMQLNDYEGVPVLNTFKTHFQADFFLPILDQLLKEYWIFYIHRDGTDVMESFARHLNFHEWDAGPKVSDGKELAQAEPAGYLMRYQKAQISDMWQRWKDHIKGWTLLPEKYRRQIIYVKFEDLNERFEKTVRDIGIKMGCDTVSLTRPNKHENVMA